MKIPITYIQLFGIHTTMIASRLLPQISKFPYKQFICKPVKSFTFKHVNSFSFDCQNCSKKTVLPECTACHRMVNYFKIFNIPQEYTVNPQTISIKAKQLQKQYHPDKHSFNEQIQKIFKQNMSKYSAYINDAKATLLDDLRRAVYMMQLKGVEIQEDTQISDSGFMVDMFSLQEEIQDGDRNKCIEIKNRIEGVMKELQGEFDNFFKAEDMKKCKQFVQKYKYLHSAYQNVVKKLQNPQSSDK